MPIKFLSKPLRDGGVAYNHREVESRYEIGPTQELTYTNPPCLLPEDVSFTADQTIGPVPLVVSFTNTSSESNLQWRWSFGDSSPQVSTEDALHTFTSAGTYVVRLVGANQCGAKVATLSITATDVIFLAHENNDIIQAENNDLFTPED
jgi:PKD repeat protein